MPRDPPGDAVVTSDVPRQVGVLARRLDDDGAEFVLGDQVAQIPDEAEVRALCMATQDVADRAGVGRRRLAQSFQQPAAAGEIDRPGELPEVGDEPVTGAYVCAPRNLRKGVVGKQRELCDSGDEHEACETPQAFWRVGQNMTTDSERDRDPRIRREQHVVVPAGVKPRGVARQHRVRRQPARRSGVTPLATR